jgi:two-component system chemotaxis sensor kinase CheA
LTAIRQRLLEVFEVEYQEHLEAIRKILSRIDGAGDGVAHDDSTEAVRHAHSLKGAARAVGLEDVETLAHGLESLFIKVERRQEALDRDLKRHVLDALDEIEDRVVASQSASSSERSSQAPIPESAPEPAPPLAPAPERVEATPFPGEPDRPRPSSVRVEATHLDRLLMSAGELHADMLQQRLGSHSMRAIAVQATALERQWLAHWKLVSADLHATHTPARLLGSGEAIGIQIKTFVQRIAATARSHEDCARSLHHHLGDLEGRVKAARMAPADSVFGSFRKMVRDLATIEGKAIAVTIEGLDCEADRLVLQRIKDPVMHMLRNAVSHGIETAEQRQAASKAAEGRIALRIATERNRLSIVIEDDGRGIDVKRVARRGVELGLLTSAQADAASDTAICQLLFQPGFSTAETVTRISGRGMGLSIAREAVSSLQGTIAVRAMPDHGTRIEISLPVSMLSRSLLLVTFRDQIYALPSDAVLKVLRVRVKDVITVAGNPSIRHCGATLPLISLGAVLHSADSSVIADKDSACVVLLHSGNSEIGVAVDQFVSVGDFVVRPLAIGGADRISSGIISTEDGTPCLVLDAEAFSIRADARSASHVVFRKRQRQAAASKVVLVVDDSITTRTLEKSILEAHGYRVRLSVDGRDAIAQLRSEPADIVVSDIEMPHLNGFELVRALKADKSLAEIPVVLVTSRDDPKDRALGLELGADAYVVKQKFDQHDLLHTIEQMT